MSVATPRTLALAVLGSAVVTAAVAYLLVTIVENQRDAREPYLRLVELDESSVDPALWGANWPHHHEQYLRTAGEGPTTSGSSAMPESKLTAQPWLRRLYDGYAFSIDYREARGHAYMLYDQTVTERVHQRPQAGACLHCHASTSVLYRKVGREALGRPTADDALGDAFDMEAVVAGFEALSGQAYGDVLAQLAAVPDGTPGHGAGLGGDARVGVDLTDAHPVACIDCHAPDTLALRVTRPGFVRGIAALAASDAAVPHLPSVERWRRGARAEPYDANQLASRQEMRSFVCGQCHVEYYCASSDVLTFPWGNGLRVEQIEAFWEGHTFPDGSAMKDWDHGETGAPLFKAQHPEFELWSQGIHARAGVSCADCHMPYERVGAKKLTSHHVRSPREDLHAACATCHHVPPEELAARVDAIQARTIALTERAAVAMTDMLDAILEAQAAGIGEQQLSEVFALQRQAMFRLDFISSENSKGFHADQESARILAESIDASRKAQALALRLRSGAPPSVDAHAGEGVLGVSEGR